MKVEKVSGGSAPKMSKLSDSAGMTVASFRTGQGGLCLDAVINFKVLCPVGGRKSYPIHLVVHCSLEVVL